MFTTLFVLGACGEEMQQRAAEDTVVIGTFFNHSSTSARRIDAIWMMLDELNASGVFEPAFTGAGDTFNDASEQQEQVKTVFGSFGAVAVITDWSSTAKEVLKVTNDMNGPYSKHIQCSGSSTNTYINDPDVSSLDGEESASDRNDTLYRAVANDKLQSKVLWNLVEDKAKVGVFYIDDAYGRSFNEEILAAADEEGVSLVVDVAFPASNFAAAELEDQYAEVLALNEDTRLDTVILVGLPGAGPQVIDQLIGSDKPFQGSFLVPHGVVVDSFFTSFDQRLTRWLADETNHIIGTTPTNSGGNYYDIWRDRLEERTPWVKFDDPMLPFHADCAFAVILSFFYSTARDQFSPDSVWRNMQRFKRSAYDGVPEEDIVDVTPDREGFRAAQAAISAGKLVRPRGPSGRLIFDDDGDRIGQRYAVVTPEQIDQYWAWQTARVLDGETGVCVESCP